MDARQRFFSELTWTIWVCPQCGAKSPKHRGSCLDEEPGLRTMHQPHQVVSKAWRDLSNIQSRS